MATVQAIISKIDHNSIQIMRLSQIVIPTPKVVEPEPEDGKIIKAYKEEMARQQLTELELNRTRIRMIDENGQIKKVPLFSEH